MLNTIQLDHSETPALSSYFESENEESCPVCAGTGWEQAFSSGRIGLRRCSEYVHLRHSLLRMGIDSKHWRCSFEQFKVFNDISARAVARIEAIATDPDHWRGTVALCAGESKGKTHLLSAMILKLLSQGRRDVAYYEMSGLLARFQAGASTRRQRADLLRGLRTTNILIIDGWDRALMAAERKRLRALVDGRSDGSRLTVIATRLDEASVVRHLCSPPSRLSRRDLTVLELPERVLSDNLFLI